MELVDALVQVRQAVRAVKEALVRAARVEAATVATVGSADTVAAAVQAPEGTRWLYFV